MSIVKIKHRAPGNYDPNQASRQASLTFLKPSRTQQHQRDESDINVIVRRYMKTGVLPAAVLSPFYAEFEESLSFQDAQAKIVAAREAFSLVPADVRARFQNNPALFHDFVIDPANKEEPIKLKLRAADPIPPPEAAPEASPK